MRIWRGYIIGCFSCCLFMSACGRSEEQRQPVSFSDQILSWNCDSYSLSSRRIRENIRQLMLREPVAMYADQEAEKYYRQGGAFLWITRDGLQAQADSLVAVCEESTSWGFSPASFYVSEIQRDQERLKTLTFDEQENLNLLMARLEFHLTKAYLRVLCGFRFGFVRPDLLWNRLDLKDPENPGSYARLWDISAERVDHAFLQKAFSAVKEGHAVSLVRQSEQSTPLYRTFKNALQLSSGMQIPMDLIRANLERARWRIPRMADRHVLVNLAAQSLQAVDPASGKNISMRVCIGSVRHKTPMLVSNMSYMQVNPYWVIPYSIVKNEIAERHVMDSSYFSRNHIKIFAKDSQDEISPMSMSKDMFLSGNYVLRQERGAGNSLGRMVFRFPNNFAVYLHDTNAHTVFQRSHRAVSHGCIRLEKPLALADFLLSDEELLEKIRISIDLPPTNDLGIQYAEDPDFKPVNTCSFEDPCPLYILYYTVYPDSAGNLRMCGDPYGYDAPLLKKLNQF